MPASPDACILLRLEDKLLSAFGDSRITEYDWRNHHPGEIPGLEVGCETLFQGMPGNSRGANRGMSPGTVLSGVSHLVIRATHTQMGRRKSKGMGPAKGSDVL